MLCEKSCPIMGNSFLCRMKNGKQRYKYAYDKLNRIILEKDLYNNKEVCYTYDNNGNILAKCIDGEVTQYRYKEGSDRLVQYGEETISYDNMGNPLTYRGMACTWEKGRQLKKISAAASRAEYDVFGLRKSKKIYMPNDSEAAGETTSYVYENGKLLRQITGSEVMDFIYGSEGVIGFKIGEAKYLYRKNVFGDITEIYDANGETVGKYSYTVYGECTVEQNVNEIAAKNPFRYRGYYYDTETGLYYLKSRYYDPEVGRFITIDDLSYLDPETINGLNLYAYCGNNPVMRTDSQGTNWWTDFWNGVVGSIFKVAIGIITIVGLGVASIFTGGAVAAIFAGAFVGALTSGLSSSVIALATGQSLSEFASGFLSSVVIGGITGAIGGIGATTGFAATTLGANGIFAAMTQSFFQTTTFQIVANAVIGGMSSIVDGFKSGGSININDISLSMIAGGIGGVLPSGIRGMFMSVMVDYLTDNLKRLFFCRTKYMSYEVIIILSITVLIFMFNRFMCSKANYYLNQINHLNAKLKFYELGIARYFLVSVFCFDANVSKRIIVYSVLNLINILLSIISAVISIYIIHDKIILIFLVCGVLELIIIIYTANFNDKTIWSNWGTRKRK